MTATITLVLALLVATVVCAILATRLRVPYAIVLVLAGALLSLLPGLPTVELNPDLILFLFLPPLVYSSAWQISWREFRASLRPILLLAIGLVLFTTAGVAVVAHVLLGLPWPIAFVLGAVLSPTDAVAASAIAKRMGLSPRLVTVLEGESMVNDATGLVVYTFAVAAAVTGSFQPGAAALQFVVVSLGGLVVGLAVGWPLAWLHRHLDDAPIEITITLLTPFAAYLLAEAAQVSGVLATLSAGLYLSRHSSRFFSSTTRLQANAVWNVLVFVLNGLLFLLIGLQLRHLLGTLVDRPLATVIGEASLISSGRDRPAPGLGLSGGLPPSVAASSAARPRPLSGLAQRADRCLDRTTRGDLPGCGTGPPPLDPGGTALSRARPPHRADLRRHPGHAGGSGGSVSSRSSVGSGSRPMGPLSRSDNGHGARQPRQRSPGSRSLLGRSGFQRRS